MAVEPFLTRAGWPRARRVPLAGDASGRVYERLFRDVDPTNGPDANAQMPPPQTDTASARPPHPARALTAVLMHAPGDAAGIRRFDNLARHLRSRGLSAPEVYARDPAAGLMLLEDFGDARFPELLAADPARERALYLAATEALAALHAHSAPTAPDLGPAVLTEQAGLAYDSYLPAFGGTGDRHAMQGQLADAFAALPPWTAVLALRDYHAGNLFWLPGRAGVQQVGVIDFQDAGLGHPLYDLVSLARDVRRDVAPETTKAMRARYAELTAAQSDAAWALLAVQRNLRILGVFAQLALTKGMTAYLDFLPRSWTLLVNDLEHASLTRLKSRLLADLPAPTPARIEKVKRQCPTAPGP